MKIAFPAGTLSYRGTHIALHDYARFNQEILGNQSVICIEAGQPGPDDLLQRFRGEFECLMTDDWADVAAQCQRAGCDAAYVIKSGERDHQSVAGLPNLVHAVFPQPAQEQHGAVYAFVSQWLSEECSNGRIPYVPHMIHLPEVAGDLRAELNIPPDATVFGCYGGMDSFDLAFAQRIVAEVCESHRHLWFVFMNIRPFASHERLLFLPASTDPVRKTRFIRTCDAMLHARSIGESFGLACGEFSVCNKPVVTYGLSPQRAHLQMLAEKAMVYRGPGELRVLLESFDRHWAAQQQWDMYSSRYNPEAVMRKFSDVFLQPSRWAGQGVPVQLDLGDRLSVQWSHLKRRLRAHSRKYHHRRS